MKSAEAKDAAVISIDSDGVLEIQVPWLECCYGVSSSVTGSHSTCLDLRDSDSGFPACPPLTDPTIQDDASAEWGLDVTVVSGPVSTIGPTDGVCGYDVTKAPNTCIGGLLGGN